MTKLHSLNRNELKYLVIIAMLIDHIAWAFVPTASLLGQIMHIIGRLTGPTMAYMLADGYYYTRSVEKYACRLGIFALLSWIPFSYFELGHIGDWAIFDILYALFFFCYRNNPQKKWTAFCMLTLFCCGNMLATTPWWLAFFQVGIFLVFPLIQFGYNGKSGSKKPFHKWFFYVFYPLHLLVLGILRWVVFA